MTAGVAVIMIGTSVVAELIICGVDMQKAGYIRCHRQNIGILTSDLGSTLKTAPDDIQYVLFQYGFSCPILGNNHCNCFSKDCGPDMLMPSSDSTFLGDFASFDK